MCVNIGHGDRRVIEAITAQALKLQYVQPAFATESRARLGAKLAEILPGDMDKVFFTLGGAEAIENAIKFARHYTGRYKILARYRTYHGATLGAMTLTGDPRRWANEPGIGGVVRYPDTHAGARGSRARSPRPAGPRGRHPLRGAAHDRGGLPRDDRRDERHPDPARRLHPGRPRDLRPPRHPDGRRRGHGRLRADRRWFAIDHWDTVPDLMTMAKGLTSSYVPLGAVAMRHHIAEHSRRDVLRRPDLQQPPGRLAAAWPRSRSTRRTTSSTTRPGWAGHAPPPRGVSTPASVRRGDPRPRAVRDHRPGAQPRPVRR